MEEWWEEEAGGGGVVHESEERKQRKKLLNPNLWDHAKSRWRLPTSSLFPTSSLCGSPQWSLTAPFSSSAVNAGGSVSLAVG